MASEVAEQCPWCWAKLRDGRECIVKRDRIGDEKSLILYNLAYSREIEPHEPQYELVRLWKADHNQ